MSRPRPLPLRWRSWRGWRPIPGMRKPGLSGRMPLLGLGRVQEADAILGPPLLPGASAAGPDRHVTTWHSNGEVSSITLTPMISPLLPQLPVRKGPRKNLSRRERLAFSRFLLQLKILHRTGRYRHVLELGRVFMGSRGIPPCALVARIATVVAQSMLAVRQPASARAVYEEILDLYTRLRCPEGVADTLLGLANTQLLDGHWDEADALYQEARFRFEEMGQSDKALASQTNLGILRAKRGDLSGGRALLSQALTRSSQLGDRRRLATILLGLGLADLRSGALGTALGHLLASLREARRSGSPRSRALAFEFLGELCLRRNRLSRAGACLRGGPADRPRDIPRGRPGLRDSPPPSGAGLARGNCRGGPIARAGGAAPSARLWGHL